MAYVPKRAAARGTSVDLDHKSLDPPLSPSRKTRSDKQLVTSRDPKSVQRELNYQPRTLQQKLALECGITTTVVGRHLKKGLRPDDIRLIYKRKAAKGGSIVEAVAEQQAVTAVKQKQQNQQYGGHDAGGAGGSSDGRVWVKDDQTGELRLENEYEAKARKERALATEREIKVAMALQTLIPRVQVTQVIGGALIELRDSLMRLPAEMRDTLAATDDPVRVDELLRQALGVRLERMQQAVRKFSEELRKTAEQNALADGTEEAA